MSHEDLSLQWQTIQQGCDVWSCFEFKFADEARPVRGVPMSGPPRNQIETGEWRKLFQQEWICMTEKLVPRPLRRWRYVGSGIAFIRTRTENARPSWSAELPRHFGISVMRTYDKLIAHIYLRRSAGCLQPRFGVVVHGRVAGTHLGRAPLQANP